MNDNKFQILKKNYDASVPEKVALLKTLAKDPEGLSKLKMEVHKIGGSAGSYGYEDVSEACKDLETEIDDALEKGTQPSSLDTAIAKIEKGYGITSEGSPSIQTYTKSYVATKNTKPLVYIVDDDVHFLSLLERIKDSFWIDLQIEANPEKARNKIRDKDFNPNALIVSEHFRSSAIKGFELLLAQKEKNSGTSIFSILFEKVSIEERLESLQHGIKYVFSKPVPAYLFLKTISEALNNGIINPFKVLIVDDDTDFCDFSGAILEEIGCVISTLNDATGLFDKLDDFKPDLLLLDILLPKYDGIHLLKTMRHDVAYRNLIVLLVTAKDRIGTKIDAYAENVDDILFKPIDPKLLQKRVLGLIDRRNILNRSNLDTTIGLSTKEDLILELNVFLQRTHQSNLHLALFKMTNKSTLTEKELNIHTSNQLLWEMDDQIKGFWLKNCCFALTFEGIPLDTVEKKLYVFLYKLVQNKDFAVNCALVSASKSFENGGEFLLAAQETIAEASTKDVDAPVRISLFSPNVQPRHIAIIDSDVHILKVLEQAFKAHGLSVSTYTEGEEALKKFLTGSENALPSLIILERKLPDMEGMDFYLKLKKRFKKPIPCLMLTVFSADKDVEDAINHGITEYIVKPFNISHLVKKALQLVFKD